MFLTPKSKLQGAYLDGVMVKEVLHSSGASFTSVAPIVDQDPSVIGPVQTQNKKARPCSKELAIDV